MTARLLFLGRHDWANLCNRVARALNAHHGATVARVWTMEPHPFGYPEDAVGPEPPPDIRAFAEVAEWVVTTGDGDYFALDAMGAKLPLRPDVRRAATHAGSSYRRAADLYNEADALRGFEVRFIGLDSIRLAPGDPTVRPYFSPAPWLILSHAPPSGWRLRVAHAPSNRAAKGTEAILAALREASDIELDVIEGVSHEQCRARLSAADVLVDQINPEVGGLGALAIEAMAFGVPVVSDVRHIAPETWARLPYPECPVLFVRDASELREAMRLLHEPREWMRCHLLAATWVRANASPEGIARLWAMPARPWTIPEEHGRAWGVTWALPEEHAAPHAPVPPPKISAAMIVKNEERGIEKALASLVGVVDEVVVVDTGSTDRTVAIVEEVRRQWTDGCAPRHIWRPTPPDATVTGAETCAACGAVSDEPPWGDDCALLVSRAACHRPAYPTLRLLHHPWRDDFSEARNFAQDACTSDWIVILDGDEVLEGGHALRAHIHAAPRMACDAVLIRLMSATGRWQRQVRAHRRAGHHWEMPVHNRLCGTLRPAASAVVVRRSYDKGHEHRMARTGPMLRRYVEQHPDDPHGPYYLAQLYAAIDWPECERWARRYVEIAPDVVAGVRAWGWLAQAVAMQRGTVEGLAVMLDALARHPDCGDLWHMLANLAACRWQQTLGADPYETWAIRRVTGEAARVAFAALDFDLWFGPDDP